MNKNIKSIILLVIILVLAFLTYKFYSLNNMMYTIILGTVTLLLTIYTVIDFINNKDEKSIYSSTIKNIYKTYDSILVKINEIPEFKKHEIIKISTIEDLIYAQIIMKKPIFAYEEEEACSFIIIGEKEICVYTLKMKEDSISQVEELTNKAKSKNKVDKNILDNIDKTTIIRVDDKKSFKVSPIRDKKETKQEEKKEQQEIEKPTKVKVDKDKLTKTLNEKNKKTNKKEEIEYLFDDEIEHLFDEKEEMKLNNIKKKSNKNVKSIKDLDVENIKDNKSKSMKEPIEIL